MKRGENISHRRCCPRRCEPAVVPLPPSANAHPYLRTDKKSQSVSFRSGTNVEAYRRHDSGIARTTTRSLALWYPLLYHVHTSKIWCKRHVGDGYYRSMDDVRYTNVRSHYFQRIADVGTMDDKDDLLLTHRRHR
uniref:Uncharacterized protein n=1 Tax=Cucumis melo TaxID=3656 RepID=A0A9I9ELG1_CUCME